MDLFQSMEIFASVVDAGSFTKAADALQMTRPSVTNAIQLLEASLGARLLHRTTRRISLTAEGEIFYERATQILDEVSDTKALFAQQGVAPRGKLRIDLPIALAEPLIIPRLREFSLQYPDIDLIVGVSDDPVDMVGDGIDCVVRIGDLQNSSLVGRRIGAVPLVSCASPAYLAEFGTPLAVDDLPGHRSVTYFSGRQRKILDWQFTVDGRDLTVKSKSSILVNDTHAFVAAGLAGFGLMQALGVDVHRHLESGSLVEVLADIQPAPKIVSILYPNRRYLSPQVRVFIEWVTELFKNEQGRWIRQT